MNAEAPQNITLHKKSQTLELVFSGVSHSLSAEFLRVHSPSAEVKGHGPGQETLQLNKSAVTINKIEMVGNYAIKITFSDGHDSGLYSWQTLSELCSHKQRYWQAYLDKVVAHNAEQELAETSAIKWVTPPPAKQ